MSGEANPYLMATAYFLTILAIVLLYTSRRRSRRN
jgi:hypothetical protein